MGACCYLFLKYLSVFWYLLYMVTGGAWFGLVLWVYLDETHITTVTNGTPNSNYVMYFLMVLGALVFLLGLLGACGACQESQCILATVSVMVLVHFASEVAIGKWIISKEDQFVTSLTETITATVKQEYGNSDAQTRAFDTIQSSLMCCGSKGQLDWADSYFNDVYRRSLPEVGVMAMPVYYKVPDSCCIEMNCDTKIHFTQASNPTHIYTTGCSKKMLSFVSTYSNGILYALLVILIIQVMAMIFSMVLCCTIRRINRVKA